MTKSHSFYGWNRFHCVWHTPHLLLCICQWTSRLPLCPSYGRVLQWTLGCMRLTELWFSQGTFPVYLNGQMISQSLTSYHGLLLPVCRVWCGSISQTSSSLMVIFFQGATFPPSSSIRWVKPCPSAQLMYFWLTTLISKSFPSASLDTHEG